jgi:hypothetical protein
MYITAAREAFEAWCGIGIVSQTYTLYLDDWSKFNQYWMSVTMGSVYYPTPGMQPNWWTHPLLLPVNPVTAVNSIQYQDPVNGLTTLNVSQYVVDTTRIPARILLLSFPSLNYNTIPRIQVSFTVGYSSVPVDLQMGILQLASDYFRAREATTEFNLKEIPFGLRGIVNRYKTWEVFDYGLV